MHTATKTVLACVLALAAALAQASGAPAQQGAPGPEPSAAPAPAPETPASPVAPAGPLAPGLTLPGGLPGASASAPAGPYREMSPAGELDWETGLATARGRSMVPAELAGEEQGLALARRAATVAARRGLFGLLCNVQVDAATTICSAMDADPRVAARVRGLVQNSHLASAGQASDGAMVVAVDMGLRGALADALLPPASRFGGRAAPAAPEPAPAEPPAPAPVPAPSLAPAPSLVPSLGPDTAPAAPAALPAAPYTGVVVDARGLGAHPALLPRLLDGQGRELYGPASLPRELAAGSGMAVYVRDLETASAHRRVAGNPLLLAARAVGGPGRTDLVLPDESAARLAALPEAARLLAQGRVVVILE
jgi:hypothetical protein